MRERLNAKLLIPALVALAVALVASPASGGPGARSSTGTASKRVSVSIRDNSFRPRSVRVPRGSRVTWRWRGSNPHNVTFTRVPRGASKRGSRTQSSGRFARSFRKSGRYRYVCTIHRALGMRGSVTVG